MGAFLKCSVFVHCLSSGLRASIRVRIVAGFFVLSGMVVVGSTPAQASEETFRDWQARCVADDHCLVATTVNDGSNTWLATVLVDAGKNDTINTMMQVLVPTGVHLASGVFVNLGRSGSVEAVYQNCAPQACIAALSLTPDDIAFMRRNTSAKIVYRPRYSTPAVTFDVSLMGFTAALAHAREVQQ